MSETGPGILDDATVDETVLTAFPDYVAVLISATALVPGPPTDNSESMLAAAERAARDRIGAGEPHDLPEVAVWREAFASFGVKPRDARSSVEALLRRVGSGLPRVDRLTDTYNAISVMHLVPIGGEDFDRYVGPPRLDTARGTESFDTVADGQPITVTATPGEIIWRDDVGVTCRRWNWRQCARTRLSHDTTTALFILDGLGQDARARVDAAAHDLVASLRRDSPDASFQMRTIPAQH